MGNCCGVSNFMSNESKTHENVDHTYIHCVRNKRISHENKTVIFFVKTLEDYNYKIILTSVSCLIAYNIIIHFMGRPCCPCIFADCVELMLALSL